MRLVTVKELHEMEPGQLVSLYTPEPMGGATAGDTSTHVSNEKAMYITMPNDVPPVTPGGVLLCCLTPGVASAFNGETEPYPYIQSRQLTVERHGTQQLVLWDKTDIDEFPDFYKRVLQAMSATLTDKG